MRSRRCTNRRRRSTPGLHDVLDWIELSVGPRSMCRRLTPRESTMHVHPTISMHLDEHERHMIEIAVEILDDGFLTEIAARLHDELPPAGPTVSYLPQRYDDLYDLALLRRWYICFLVVTERLANGWTPLRCRGEELALQAIIECAREQLELNRLDSDDSDDSFFASRTPCSKTSTTSLWHPKTDGVDDPDTAENQRLGVEPRHPSTWFEPLDPNRAVHPYLSSSCRPHRPAAPSPVAVTPAAYSPEMDGAIAVLTLALVVITAYYAWQNHKMVKDAACS